DQERELLRDFRAFAQTLSEAETLRIAVTEAHRKRNAADHTFADAGNAHEAHVTRSADLNQHRTTAQHVESQRQTLTIAARDLAAALAAADAFEKADRFAAQAQKSCDAASTARAEAAEALAAKRATLQAHEAALLENHASHIAAHLNPGAPCPVCGARDHPALARGAAADTALPERFRQAKAEADDAQRVAEAATHAFVKAESNLQQADRARAGLDRPAEPSSVVARKLGDVERQIAALGKPVDLAALDEQIAQAAARVGEAADAMTTAQEARDRARVAAQAAETELSATLKPIPEALRAADALDRKIDATTARLAAFDEQLAAATQARQAVETQLTAAVTTLDIATGDQKRADERFATAQAQFTTALGAGGFTPDAFASAASDSQALDGIQARLSAFDERLADAKGHYARAEAAIAETDRPDIAALKELAQAAETAHATTVQQAADAQARLKHLAGVQDQVDRALAELEAREAETGPLRDLADSLSGDNELRTDLETFAIGWMFGHVLASANQRLKPMTAGRYRLVHEHDLQGRGRRGLDITVEDAFTGRRRPTSTLSGGETFIAALALALGLSDVVESTGSGVRLDAIFIDEGFGSLDSEDGAGTLDRVLQTLVDLGGRRRAVGLISHVPLVQQTVPNGFWVTATPSGSTIEERP
ncbi:MAG: SbcC/MukB-like Walker B domain-containing protein, partial [Pseudomonadota bacterium]